MRTAIITGASSGVGKALAEELAKKGVRLGLMARRIDLLKQIEQRFKSEVVLQVSDFSNPDEALEHFKHLWTSLGRVDCVFLNAGVSLPCQSLSWENDRNTLQVNAASFTAMAGESVRRFLDQGAGHLVGVSSVAGTRGSGRAPVYGATKAYISNYLQGLRQQIKTINPLVYITDIRPGFVDTAMIRETAFKFWMCSPEKAASQILDAVEKKKRAAYVTRRWKIVAWIYLFLPEFLLERIYARYLKKESE